MKSILQGDVKVGDVGRKEHQGGVDRVFLLHDQGQQERTWGRCNEDHTRRIRIWKACSDENGKCDAVSETRERTRRSRRRRDGAGAGACRRVVPNARFTCAAIARALTCALTGIAVA